MFDKNLFYALCEKYNVELSSDAKTPIIKDENGVHGVATEDISRIFAKHHTFWEYTGQKLDAGLVEKAYYLQDDFAIAC